MSLGIVIKGPEGLVLGAESRVTIAAETAEGQSIPVTFDNATKVLAFGEDHTYIGVVTYGLAAIGFRTAHSFVPEFEAELPQGRLKVRDFADRLGTFFMKQWKETMPPDYQGPNMVFIVAGFDEGEPYGRVFLVEIPRNATPNEKHGGPAEFGITWGGQRRFVDRLIRGYDHRLPDVVSSVLKLSPSQQQAMRDALEPMHMRIPFAALALQDCVDLAVFFLRTTINAQRLAVALRGSGGPIDVATITRSGALKFVQRKQIVGEKG